MEKPYHIVGKENTEELAKFLVKSGQSLLPMVELIEQSKMAVDELIDVLGRAQIEAVLRLSAEGVAGPPYHGPEEAALQVTLGQQQPVIAGVLDQTATRLQQRDLEKAWGAVDQAANCIGCIRRYFLPPCARCR